MYPRGGRDERIRLAARLHEKIETIMSNLTDIDKRYLEKILNMGGGYVMDYTDATFD